jgi:hypothetical protein
LEGVIQYSGNDSDQKGCRLSRTGLGPAACILSRQCAGKNFRLDRRAVLKAKIADGMKELIVKPEIVKPGLAFRRRDLEL